MNNSLFFIITTILFLNTGLVNAQETPTKLEFEYLDAQLYNGELFNIVKQSNIKGHQFFLTENFVKGKVKIKGIEYNCDQLNLDIFNQKVLLKFLRPNGSVKIIALSDAWLEEFSIENYNFIINGKSKAIYQIIGDSSVQICYQWKKKLSFKSSSNQSYYYYSEPEKESYIKIGDKLINFSNNRSFLSVFSPQEQIEIKHYMKENKINVKNATDMVMLSLITFCGNNRR